MSGQLTDNAQAQINTYFDQIKNNIQMQGVSLRELSDKNDELYKKQQIQLNQLKEILLF